MNVKGTKSRWLTHTIESIPVHHWEQELELTPEKFVTAALKTDFAKEILQGVTRSASRTASASWAAAITMKPDVMKQLDLQEIGALMLSLAFESREELVERLVSSKSDAAHTVLSFAPAPWGEKMSRAAFEHMLKPLASRQNLDYNDRIMLTQLADGLSGSLFPQVISVATVAGESPSTAKQWNDFLSRYTFRTQLEKEFSL
jgi:predicted metal-binding transcription factor (methanogenesis marker protein 9)